MPSNPPRNLKAAIFGIEGENLLEEEKSFFKEHNPVGFILFARNCSDPDQVKKLVNDLRETVGWHAPVLIDQEGGRVARLTPPHWRKAPAAGLFAELAEKNITQAEDAVYLNARLIANELHDLGINVDCAPMADINFPFSHDIIGDRAFGNDPEIISKLCKQMARGLTDGGVIPVLKHIPGHGRAQLDSHEDLPEVDAANEELKSSDFIPFKNLKDVPWGMTAHITYSSIDPKSPATLSKKVIDIVRSEIGFSGLLLTDDLSMKALDGSFAKRTIKSIEAGCDVVLHCNGKMDEMSEIANNCPEISEDGYNRLVESYKSIKQPEDFTATDAISELERMLA